MSTSKFPSSSGSYLVVFDRSVAGCSFTTNHGSADLSALSGQVVAARRSGVANGVFVQLYTSAGYAQDGPFHLVVTC